MSTWERSSLVRVPCAAGGVTVAAVQYFGELALLCNEPRAASVVTTTDVALLKMSKADFEATMGPLSKYFSDKAKINYGLSGPASKDIKLSDLKIVRSLPAAAAGHADARAW